MKGVLIIKVKHVSFSVRNKFKMHLTSCFSLTIEHFYITWLVLLGKKGSFSHFKALYEVNTSSGEYSLFHHEIFGSSAERLSSLTFPPISSPEQKAFCLLATKEQIYGEWKRRNVTACGTQNICFIFLPRLFKVPQPLLQKHIMRWIMALKLAIILNSMCCCFEAQSALS